MNSVEVCNDRMTRCLPLALDADEALAGGVDGELAKVRRDPLATQTLRSLRSGTGTAEEVRDDVTLI